MRFSSAILALAGLAGLTMAVDINIYPSSESCDDNGGGLQCTGVAERTCCHNSGGDIFSARFIGLVTEGVPDQGVIAQGPGPDAAYCDTACNAGGGDSTICINPDTCPAATGAYWTSVTRRARQAPAKCQNTIKPDRAFFGNGQSFHINYEVPTNVTEMLVNLVKSDPNLTKGAPAELLPWEIQA